MCIADEQREATRRRAAKEAAAKKKACAKVSDWYRGNNGK